MAGAENKTATFGIHVNATTDADLAAASVEELSQKISKAQDAVKSWGAAQRALRGSSDEVKEAREKLKVAIASERDEISRANLALGKQGQTYEEVSKAMRDAARAKEKLESQAATKSLRDAAEAIKANTKAAAEAKEKQAALGGAIDRIGGPAAEAKSKLGALSEVLGGMGSIIGVVAVGFAALLAAVTAFAAGVVFATKAIAEFMVEQGALLRAQGLEREAWLGSADEARRWGNQIDALGRKVPSSRAELQGLATDVMRAFDNTRLTRAGMVDAFNAIGQASAALGKQAGSQIQSIIERGKNFGLFGLNFYQNIDELRGTGIKSVDVAQQLSKNLGISLRKAEMLLLYHRVRLEDGVKAIRQVVEKRFGDINAKKMLDLAAITQKFRDNVQGLAKDFAGAGGPLEGILKHIDDLAKNFDVTTANGFALKAILDGIGKAMGFGADKATPIIQNLFDLAINYTLRFGLLILDVRDKIAEWPKTFRVVFEGLKGFIEGLIPGLNQVKFALNAIDALKSVGASAGKGLAEGLNSMRGLVMGAAGGLGNDAQNAAKKSLDVHSPSRVFERIGKMSGEGYAEGLEGTDRRVEMATQETMAPSAPRSASGETSGASGGARTANVTLTLILPNVKDGGSFAQELESPSLRAAVTKLFEEMATGAGYPTQTPQGSLT